MIHRLVRLDGRDCAVRCTYVKLPSLCRRWMSMDPRSCSSRLLMVVRASRSPTAKRCAMSRMERMERKLRAPAPRTITTAAHGCRSMSIQARAKDDAEPQVPSIAPGTTTVHPQE